MHAVGRPGDDVEPSVPVDVAEPGDAAVVVKSSDCGIRPRQEQGDVRALESWRGLGDRCEQERYCDELVAHGTNPFPRAREGVRIRSGGPVPGEIRINLAVRAVKPGGPTKAGRRAGSRPGDPLRDHDAVDARRQLIEPLDAK
jgi:hypothetical protein